ncbi:cytoplasmic glycerophosphodiester phosphodiesterase [Pseudovibrio axinellae]|uniref:Cytoplasmic glycerophosphodiester phosphodiesterase n=1 Tax=Pseudovibrio axinellae TaxID=989403 RepID=A0A166AMZ5_9HYPH|nr:glycerophosphodiester phosphodiesterase family protein [Pseudovibrio axinellae]KZL21326.1 cytoplasmic glycerophosphodiester phosphodiesterase [Pseudovibrio axinellae]SEQ96224.1 glycerophosphoryl diester phosphodiesterase [Pseudovibrio axinellae]
MFKKIVLLLLLAFSGVYLYNASWLSSQTASGKPKFIAHRGVHQTYHRNELTNQTCTAERIDTPTHSYLENTIASMQAAFEAGADIVELDVHPTTDNKLAVFHDWTLDCRTNGLGITRSHSLAKLKALDIGYGYTSDGGKTYPLRGTGIGAIPELEEVFRALPGKKFLINFKEKELRSAELLQEKLEEHPEWKKQVWGVYGASAPTWHIAGNAEEIAGFDKTQTKACLEAYMIFGWSGYVPQECRDTVIGVPSNYTWAIWGWPHKFQQRLKAYDSEIIAAGPYRSQGAGGGIDTPEQLSAVPNGFSGYIWTNKIEVLSPYIKGSD